MNWYESLRLIFNLLTYMVKNSYLYCDAAAEAKIK